ncbi:SDR family NAD(P)-dependent oxidoreductase [Flavobacterium anhuiense]|uniref:SDR family NAD(P)-dependent oxidoreductase n=1 Tax=Flavobacterium anhuiense TaxID=459526 RepID=UPI0024E218C9|nr:SDR family NAD(P)-dependent oxidoreductase [Flavobacterium anhuiense]
MNLSDNKILITGGASGIGLGLAERFIQENNIVIICGRRASLLEEVKAKFPSIITKVCDLSLEEERIALYQWIAANHPDLNVLVNNAGIQNWMNITDPDFYNNTKNELATNIEAPLHLTSLFIQLSSLKTVMNVTSGLAFSPFAKVPGLFGYKSIFQIIYTFTSSFIKRKKY